MITLIMVLTFLYAAELLIGVAILSFILHPLRQVRWSVFSKRVVLTILGVILVSPVLAPAGTLAVIPVPISVLMAFTRSSADVGYMLHTSWFIALSMLVTALLCRYVARRMFPE